MSLLRYIGNISLCSCFTGESSHDLPSDISAPQMFQDRTIDIEQLEVMNESSQSKAIPLQLRNLARVENSFAGLLPTSCKMKLPTSLFVTETVAPSAASQVNGATIHRYTNGAEYRGDWEDGEPQGHGEMRWSSDMWYKGMWTRGMPCGDGQMQLRQGTKFSGKWVKADFKCEALSLMMLPSFEMWLRSVDDGYVWLWCEWYREAMSAVRQHYPTDSRDIVKEVSLLTRAVTTMTDVIDCSVLTEDTSQSDKFVELKAGLRLYRGCHLQGKPCGLGKVSYGPKCSYMGEFFNGKPQGFGIYSWPNGNNHSGLWLNGEKDGFGMTSTANPDNITVGIWKLGHLVRQLSLTDC